MEKKCAYDSGVLVKAKRAGEVILEVGECFGKMSGRSYGFFEEYRTEDAEYLMIIMGSAAGTAKAAVDQLREEGHKVGVLKLRVFRPFPEKEIAEAISRSGCRAVAIMDRCESYNGCSGPLGSEIPAGLYRNKVMTQTVNYIYGLAGRDFTVDHVRDIFAELEEVAQGTMKAPNHKYIGLRE